MTPDAIGTGQIPESDDHEKTEVPGPSYEPPVLVPLGNVHALLASGGMSPQGDASKVSKRRPM